MLEGPQAEAGGNISGLMVVLRLADETEVEARQPGVFERGEVGVIGHVPIDFGHERICHRARHGPSEFPDEWAVVAAGFVHQDGPADPTCIEVERAADVFYPWASVGEGLAAGKRVGRLLAVGEEQDDVVS